MSAWISVGERLPDSTMKTLVYCPARHEKVTLGEHMYNPEGGYWTDCTEQYGDEGWPGLLDVSHWMPLPEPPK